MNNEKSTQCKSIESLRTSFDENQQMSAEKTKRLRIEISENLTPEVNRGSAKKTPTNNDRYETSKTVSETKSQDGEKASDEENVVAVPTAPVNSLCSMSGTPLLPLDNTDKRTETSTENATPTRLTRSKSKTLSLNQSSRRVVDVNASLTKTIQKTIADTRSKRLENELVKFSARSTSSKIDSCQKTGKKTVKKLPVVSRPVVNDKQLSITASQNSSGNGAIARSTPVASNSLQKRSLEFKELLQSLKVNLKRKTDTEDAVSTSNPKRVSEQSVDKPELKENSALSAHTRKSPRLLRPASDERARCSTASVHSSNKPVMFQ